MICEYHGGYHSYIYNIINIYIYIQYIYIYIIIYIQYIYIYSCVTKQRPGLGGYPKVSELRTFFNFSGYMDHIGHIGPCFRYIMIHPKFLV